MDKENKIIQSVLNFAVGLNVIDRSS